MAVVEVVLLIIVVAPEIPRIYSLLLLIHCLLIVEKLLRVFLEDVPVLVGDSSSSARF